jgi:hypothetical protein
MESKIQPGRWYILAESEPRQDTRDVTSCMQVGNGVLVKNVTFIGGNRSMQSTPQQSSESMVLIPNMALTLEGGHCVFNPVAYQ